MLTKQDVDALCAPFSAADHEFHRGFVYIGEEAITARIEAIDPSWELSLNWITNRESFSTAHVTLTICGVKRDGIGMATQEYSKVAGKPDKAIGEPEKSAATDALKRAARLFGIGRYLLDAPKDLTDANLSKWVAKITPQATPAAPVETIPALFTFDIDTVTHSVTSKDAHYYHFGDGIFTFSRDPFRDAGVTECESWADLPLDTPSPLLDRLAVVVKQKSADRFEIVSVNPLKVKS